MATSRPRITISLRREDYEVLKRLSVASRVPMARTVTELVEAAGPYLGRAAQLVERAAKLKGPELFSGLVSSLEGAARDPKEHMREAFGEAERVVESVEVAQAALSRAQRAAGRPNPRPSNHGGQVAEIGAERAHQASRTTHPKTRRAR